MLKLLGNVRIPEMGRLCGLFLLSVAVVSISRSYAAENRRPQLAFSGLRFPYPNSFGRAPHSASRPASALFPYSRACARRRAVLCQLDPGSEKFQALEKR